MKKLKILELTNYSAGGCGVGARVLQEAEMLSKKHDVHIFSSYYEKGTNKICSAEETKGKVKIKRFPALQPGLGILKYIPGGQSYMFWRFQKEALEFKPDVIIAHAYRHPHTTQAIKIAKKLGAKLFLVTHAPFLPERHLRKTLSEKLSVWFYDHLIAPITLNKFDKIIAITPWEIPILEKIGVKKEKIVLIPNGLKEEFFKNKAKSKEQSIILFMGRISPIKDLETLILSINYIKDKTIKINIIGPAEPQYLAKLKSLIKENNLYSRVKITDKVYTRKEQIENLDSSKIYVLPSKSEAMPQTLIEAMARGKIVIASNNRGSSAIVQDRKTGYLFQVGNAQNLAEKIDLALSANQNNLKNAAKAYVKQFHWDILIKKLESLF